MILVTRGSVQDIYPAHLAQSGIVYKERSDITDAILSNCSERDVERTLKTVSSEAAILSRLVTILTKYGARMRRVRCAIETTPQLAQKLVFCNSDLDKSTTFGPLKH
jgi:hypothetical protein